jgi:hypothetical protein
MWFHPPFPQDHSPTCGQPLAACGEVIRSRDQTPSLRKFAVERLLRDLIHEDGGPLIHHGSEEEQRLLRLDLP